MPTEVARLPRYYKSVQGQGLMESSLPTEQEGQALADSGGFVPISKDQYDTEKRLPRDTSNPVESLTYFQKDSTGNLPVNPLTRKPYATADINPATNQPYTQSGYTGYVAASSSAKQPNRDEIRTQKLNDAQAVIDALNAQYGTIINNEKVAGLGRENRTRALNVGNNLAGSNLASTQAQVTENKNTAIINNLEAEKGAKIQAILNDVAAETDEVYESRRKEFLADAEDDIDKRKKFETETQSKATSRIANLAAAGLSLGELEKSDPDTYKNLLRDSGLSEIEFDAMWNNKAGKQSFEYKEMKNGELLRIGSDGEVKSMGSYTPPDETGSWEVESMKDGSLYWVKKDTTGNRLDIKKFETEKSETGFTLTPGQKRYDSKGKLIANNPRVGGTNGVITTKETPEEKAQRLHDEAFNKDVNSNITKLANGGSWAAAYDTLYGVYGKSDPELFQQQSAEEIAARGGDPGVDETYADVILNKKKYYSQTKKSSSNNSDSSGDDDSSWLNK